MDQQFGRIGLGNQGIKCDIQFIHYQFSGAKQEVAQRKSYETICLNTLNRANTN